jgi:hypothetical protein
MRTLFACAEATPVIASRAARVRLEHTLDVSRESIVKPSSVARAAFVAALFAFVSVAVEAQPVTKAPPRLPANPTASGRIPAGVDTGSPASSDTLQLGTPVPPAMGAESSEMRARGAAARAAARPKPATSAPDCVRQGAVTGSAKGASAPAAAKAGSTGASAAKATPTGC